MKKLIGITALVALLAVTATAQFGQQYTTGPDPWGNGYNTYSQSGRQIYSTRPQAFGNGWNMYDSMGREIQTIRPQPFGNGWNVQGSGKIVETVGIVGVVFLSWVFRRFRRSRRFFSYHAHLNCSACASVPFVPDSGAPQCRSESPQNVTKRKHVLRPSFGVALIP